MLSLLQPAFSSSHEAEASEPVVSVAQILPTLIAISTALDEAQTEFAKALVEQKSTQSEVSAIQNEDLPLLDKQVASLKTSFDSYKNEVSRRITWLQRLVAIEGVVIVVGLLFVALNQL